MPEIRSNAEPPFEVILLDEVAPSEARWLVRVTKSASGSIIEKKDCLGSCRLDRLSIVFGSVLLLDSDCGLSFELTLCLSLEDLRSPTLSSALTGVGDEEVDG